MVKKEKGIKAMIEKRNARLDKFQKKAIISKLKEENIIGMLYNDIAHRRIKYNVFYKYKNQIFCSPVEWINNHYSNDPIPTIEQYVQRIKIVLNEDKKRFDEELYSEDKVDNRGLIDIEGETFEITSLVRNQLTNIFHTGEFKEAENEYYRDFYLHKDQLINLRLSKIQKHIVYRKIMESLLLSEKEIIDKIRIANND